MRRHSRQLNLPVMGQRLLRAVKGAVVSLGGPLRNEVELSVCMGSILFLISKVIWSYILPPCIFKAWEEAAAGRRLSREALGLVFI